MPDTCGKPKQNSWEIRTLPDIAKESLPVQAESTCSAIRKNMEAVRKMEDDFLRARTWADRLADAIGGFTGSLKFVVLHIFFYGGWILINAGLVPGIRKFDPFPFMLLAMMVSLEAIFLSTFVLMKQNRMSRREDLRAHLDLQINLLAEREMTLVLQMLQKISTRLGIQTPGDEIEELTEDTPVEALASELQQKLQEE
jgi:uncharacterized membrane protein